MRIGLGSVCNQNYAVDSRGGRLRQLCADQVFEAADALLGGKSRYKPESAWNTRNQPATPGYDGGKGYRKIPDVTIVVDSCKPTDAGNVERVAELKFGGDRRRRDQDDAYLEIAGGDPTRYQVFRCDGTPKDDETLCDCLEQPEPLPEPVLVPAVQPEWKKWATVAGWSLVTVAAAAVTIAAVLVPIDGPAGDIAAGSATLAAAARAAAAWRALAPAF